MNKSVLIVEDEKRMRDLLVDYFEVEGYDVYEAKDGVMALDVFHDNTIDLIILDIMMPKLDGYSVCRKIRKESNTLIIMLTAREEEDDKLLGFELGADEYVTKPFSPKVLIARANTLLKRFESLEKESNSKKLKLITYGPIDVNEAGYQISYNKKALSLTNKEYELMLLLIKNKGIVFKRESILDSIWGYDYVGDGRVVDTNIKTIRKKIGLHSKWIKTVIGVGYKFEDDINV
jgi:DNA-binding response OmpR family regulator